MFASALVDISLELICSCSIQSRIKCLADVCGALHCDRVVETVSQKSKCNPAAAARKKHMCEVTSEDFLQISSLFPQKNHHPIVQLIAGSS